jgi:hypothetical protein
MGASLPHRLAAVSLVTSLMLAASCHPSKLSPQGDADRIVITEAMIARSGGPTAWEVLRCEVPQMAFDEDRNGQATRMTRRGHTSFILSATPTAAREPPQTHRGLSAPLPSA